MQSSIQNNCVLKFSYKTINKSFDESYNRLVRYSFEPVNVLFSAGGYQKK